MLKVRTAMGLHRCRVMVTGAAPMPPYIMEFLRVAINPKLGVLQGYGMTETAAGVAASESDDLTMGHVGGPMPSAEIRLRDVPEMGYMTANNPPTGEVLARGPSIFQGYYKNPEATAETLLPGGWIATGDVGRWNPNGSLSIVDRKKNIFKLSQGEYVAAEKLELVYARAKLVGQIFVYGNSYKPFLVAVVVPGFDKLLAYATEKGWWTTANLALLSPEFRAEYKKVVDTHREEIRQVILKGIEEEAKKEKFQGFEAIKDVHLVSEIDELGMGFTVANDCMTPTFKLRRPFIVKLFKEQIMDLYRKNGEAPKGDEKW
jgi:long-chain acyl-CoA synthetase